MEEGIRARPRVKVRLARPPQEEKEEGTEAKIQPGADRARPPQDKWVGRWPKRTPKGGKGPGEATPRKNGGGARGQTPTRGRPGETTPGKNGGGNRGRPNERVGNGGGPQAEEERQHAKGPPQVERAVWRRRSRPQQGCNGCPQGTPQDPRVPSGPHPTGGLTCQNRPPSPSWNLPHELETGTLKLLT